MAVKAPPVNLHAETRERVLEAAARVFADKGLEHATVRDICALAGANIAAVNYHFRDKHSLYIEVFRRALQAGLRRWPPAPPEVEGKPVRVRLHAFIRAKLHRMLEDGGQNTLSRLMLAEMSRPSGLLDDVLRDYFRANLGVLRPIVEQAMGGAVSDADALLACKAIVGQCLVHRMGMQRFTRIMQGPPAMDAAHIDRLADHITEFSLAGLKALAKSIGPLKEHA